MANPVRWRLVIVVEDPGQPTAQAQQARLALDMLLPDDTTHESAITRTDDAFLMTLGQYGVRATHVWATVWEWNPNDPDDLSQGAAEFYLHYVRGGLHLDDDMSRLVDLIGPPAPVTEGV